MGSDTPLQGRLYPIADRKGHSSMLDLMMCKKHPKALCSPTPMDVLAIFALYQKPP